MEKENKTDGMRVEKHSLVDNLRYCLGNTWECYPPLLSGCLFAILSGTAIPVINTFLPKVVIEKITSGESPWAGLWAALLLTLAAALLSGVKVFCEKYVYHHKFKMNTYYVKKISLKGMTTDYCNQESDRFRKLQTESFLSCNGNYSAMTQVYDVGIALCSNLLGLFLYFGILLRLNTVLIIFLLATTFTSYYLNGKVIRWTEKHRAEKVAAGQRIGYITGVSSDLKSAKDIRLYRMAVWLGNVYKQNMELLGRWYRRYSKKVFGTAVCDSGLVMIRDIAAYAYLLYLIAAGKISVADFVLYFGVITGFSVWLSGMLAGFTAWKRVSLQTDYLRTFLDYPDRYRRDGGIDAAECSRVPAVLSLCDVSYRYEGAETDTLSRVSLTLKPGEHLAIVGLNGAGKTTLVKLLCGLIEPSEGGVCYNGTDVKEYDRNSYYRLFSAVFQQFSVLPVTFAEITAGAAAAKPDREKVKECLKKAGLWEKISSLEKGIDSEYGKTISDEGTELSGGELQKLLLARALYKNAPVIILDEPTAALDPIAESRLYETYNEVMKESSAVFISHRLASTRFCDRIILLENGTIVEEGTHEELLAAHGRYRELYETQAQYYRESREEGGEAL